MASLKKTIGKFPLKFFIIFLFFLCLTIFLCPSYIHIVDWQFIRQHFGFGVSPVFSEETEGLACPIPFPNAFDKSVMKFVVKKGPLNCKFMQPELTYLDEDGILYINQSAIDAHNIEENTLSCKYSTLIRKSNDDDGVNFDPVKILNYTAKMPIDREYVEVKCDYNDTKKYLNYHSYISKKSGIKVETTGKDFKPQVFILVLESMSRLNLIRHMPKTYKYLTDVLKSEILKGMTKVADNSFPNMIALLTGRKVRMKPKELPGNEKKGPYDEWPFLWKNFSKAGYITALTEDDPIYTILNYLSKGCLKQPTDHYPRAIWMARYRSSLWKKGSDYCFGNIPTYTVLFNWIKQFLKKYSQELYFLFSFYIQITHNEFNNAQYLDEDVYQLLKQFNDDGYFKNTIVILMGDHGNRYGKVLKTYIGHLEERMPLFSISIPSTLEQNHPHLRKYLRRNSERLSTWLDVHSMLMDVATSTYEESEPIRVWNTRGYSVWRMEIPENRTCEMAGVPENYCVCEKETSISVNDSRAIEASNALVEHINHLLRVVNQSCVTLSLKETLQAIIVAPNHPTFREEVGNLNIRITVSLIPSDGIVDSILQKASNSAKFVVLEDINRINKYGNQSACIEDKELRKFCYCKTYLTF